MSEDKKYNGWTNYETWAVNLWMTNDQGSDEYWRENAQAAYDHAEADQTFTRMERAALDLADVIKENHEEMQEEALDGAQCSVFVDLLNAAMSEVNWYEIAEAFLSDVEKETEEVQE